MIDRIELMRKIPYEQMTPTERKGLEKGASTSRTVRIQLDGLEEDVLMVKEVLLEHNNEVWPLGE